MKIVITGHTKGLGKVFFDYFSKEHEVIGCSRSNGYSLPEKLSDVIFLARKADLFINNAHVQLAQSAFISYLYKECDIITCGSIGANFHGKGNSYYDHKKIIEDTHHRCKKTTDKALVLLKMGYLENFPDKKPITYQEILNAVIFWLNNKRVSLIEFENHCDIYRV